MLAATVRPTSQPQPGPRTASSAANMDKYRHAIHIYVQRMHHALPRCRAETGRVCVCVCVCARARARMCMRMHICTATAVV